MGALPGERLLEHRVFHVPDDGVQNRAEVACSVAHRLDLGSSELNSAREVHADHGRAGRSSYHRASPTNGMTSP